MQEHVNNVNINASVNVNENMNVISECDNNTEKAKRVPFSDIYYKSDVKKHFIDELTQEFVCAKCGKPFALMRYNVPGYTYKLNQGRKMYCRYNCWIEDRNKVRMSYSLGMFC